MLTHTNRKPYFKQHALAFSALALFAITPTWADSAVSTCFGEKHAMPLGSQMPFFKAAVGKYEGYFLLDYGSTASTIDPNAFIGGKPEQVAGTTNQFDDFNFFGPWGRVTLSVQNHSNIQGLGSIKQAGILGNDFLSLGIFTLDYANQTLYKALENNFCADADLRAVGFKAVSSAGYFSNDKEKLNNNCTPNIPTIPIKIGKVTAVAQIDPGYDDVLYKHSVNINQALYKSLLAGGVKLLAQPSNNFSLSTCVSGLSEAVTAYKLDKGSNFEITGTDGNPVSVTPNAFIFVKQTPAGAKACGGIGTWQIPAAQFGASFLKDAKKIIFDPFQAKVWFYTK